MLVKSEKMADDTPQVSGYDFSRGRDLDGLLESLFTTGYQATSFGQCIREVHRMLQWRLSDEPITDDTEDAWKDEELRRKTSALVFLGFTSNLISSGVRESFVYLAKNRMVDVFCTTAGGIEEDFIKCLAPTYLGDFALKGVDLRKRGLNRIGNLLVPNDNYCKFEDWIMPILDQLLVEQEEHGVNWTPSKIIHRLGKEINDPASLYYWCYVHDIPVFCPALTDGSIGDMLYFHTYKTGLGPDAKHLKVDITEDIRRINDIAVRASPRRTGVIILGGGLPKHHIFNANLMRNGADFCTVISTATEWDGSDSGARPDEAISWGKVRIDAQPVKAYGDATILFPLLVSQTYARTWAERPRAVPSGGVSAHLAEYRKAVGLEKKSDT